MATTLDGRLAPAEPAGGSTVLNPYAQPQAFGAASSRLTLLANSASSAGRMFMKHAFKEADCGSQSAMQLPQAQASQSNGTLYKASLMSLRSDSASSLSGFGGRSGKHQLLHKQDDDLDDFVAAKAVGGRQRRSSRLASLKRAPIPDFDYDAQPMELAPAPPAPPARVFCTIYTVPSTFHIDHNSSQALAVANKLMASVSLPGVPAGHYLPVLEGSFLYHHASAWNFTAMSIALGSSYFQRLCYTVPSVEWAAQRHPNFTQFAAPRPLGSHSVLEELGANYYNSADYHSREMMLKSILFTCVFISSKNVDRVSHASLLRHMLGKIYGVPVTYDHAYEVENKCLDGLGWRLGPHCCHDQLDEVWEAPAL